MTADLAGRRVLVTGASRGIGLAVTEAFIAAGCTLHMLADDPAVLDEAARRGAMGQVCDITDRSAVIAALERIGGLDVLVNNAGIERMTPLEDRGGDVERDVRRVVEVNIVGTDLVTRHALPHLGEGASIINTASVWGRVAEPLFGAYVASKHAVIGLTKTWARELGSRGIRVNAVCPGWVRTPSAMASLARMAARGGRPADELLAGIVATQALGGLMEPSDVVGPYLYLASSLARNVTGQTLGVDRGEVPW
jgi:NAD(P)-dependent dehydrogenase (short-subunit alcohol dehydrogenase family)